MTLVALFPTSLLALLLALLLGTALSGCGEPPSLSTSEAAAHRNDAIWVDVRTQEEWDAGHLLGAMHLPVTDITADSASALRDPAQPVLVYCRSGGRATAATAKLIALGIPAVAVTGGGIDDLRAAGLAYSPAIQTSPTTQQDH